MGNLRRLVLDVLKPLEPSIVELAQLLAERDGVDGVNISIYEIDRRVENAKITIEGHDLRFDEIADVISENGGAVHSIDEVAVGKTLVDEEETLEERIREAR